MKRVLLTAAALGLFGAALWSATRSQSAVECEACLEFEGRRACRTVRASTREEAEQGAVMNACALLAGGVTSSLACQGTPPRSLRCSE